MQKSPLLVTLLVAPFPFFLKAVAQAPTGPGSGHGFLIDKLEAGLIAPPVTTMRRGPMRPR